MTPTAGCASLPGTDVLPMLPTGWEGLGFPAVSLGKGKALKSQLWVGAPSAPDTMLQMLEGVDQGPHFFSRILSAATCNLGPLGRDWWLVRRWESLLPQPASRHVLLCYSQVGGLDQALPWVFTPSRRPGPSGWSCHLSSPVHRSGEGAGRGMSM